MSTYEQIGWFDESQTVLLVRFDLLPSSTLLCDAGRTLHMNGLLNQELMVSREQPSASGDGVSQLGRAITPG
jgi:hypothetical protein